MARTGPVVSIVALAVFFGTSPAPAAPGRPLTIEERVRAQERIERVYYAHQLGATEPFEDAVPRALIEAKVRASLRRSVALERFWQDGITAADLRAETERILRGTRFPGRLRELLDALDDDVFLFQECVARASLTERRLRSHYGDGMRLVPMAAGAGREDRRPRARMSQESWWAGIEAQLDPSDIRPVAQAFDLPLPSVGQDDAVAASLTGCNDDTWSSGALGGIDIDGRYAHSAVWTGSLMIVWGGRLNSSTLLNTGFRYDALTDTWAPMSTVGAPSARTGHVAVWTGSRMLIWGVGPFGARYDPVADAWSPITTTAAPDPVNSSYRGVWTGSRMIVWARPSQAGRYDPVQDTWAPITTVGAPIERLQQTAVWTGSRMVIWGGLVGLSDTNTGGLYDPVSNTWSPTAVNGSTPGGRHGHTAVWTGSQMIFWGGALGTSNNPTVNTGGRYDPVLDQWFPVTQSGAPFPMYLHTAVWTGQEMIVWLGSGKRYRPDIDMWTGDTGYSGLFGVMMHSSVWDGSTMIIYGGTAGGTGVFGAQREGARYSPSTGEWRALASRDAPTVRSGASTVWTGNEMIVWGGSDSGTFFNTGSRYDPLLDVWSPVTTTGPPVAREGHTALWTGSKMIVWGGIDAQGNPVNSGGRYDPNYRVWYGMSAGPAGRSQHTAVWTGSRMIVWGGVQNGTLLASGGLYDPRVDTWAATSTTNAPVARTGHSAVWSGSRVLVWGGWNAAELDNGAGYDPALDAWSAIAATSAPDARQQHSAVWTGHEMVVWGGHSGPVPPGPFYKNTGGRYDPALDAWAPTTLADAPSPRSGAGAVWTGTEMVIWSEGTGGRYHPSSDSWTAMSTTGAPPIPGSGASAIVWSGDEVLVWGSKARTGGLYSVDMDLDGSANTCDPDDDGDGISDDLDCGPLDASNSATHPAEVANLKVKGPATHLEWDAQAGVWYDVVRGVLSELRPLHGIRNATCVADHLPSNTWDDPSPGPSGGVGWLYLVRARNSLCPERAYGPSTNGVALIPAIDCP